MDRQGSPVADARIWLSYAGHLNWGNEVARTAPDGTFSVRSITTDSYIGARAAGHAASNLRQLKAEAGSTARVKIVLGGRGGKITGMVRDARGNPIENAKVMIKEINFIGNKLWTFDTAERRRRPGSGGLA